MNWAYLLFAAAAIYVLYNWISDHLTARRISETLLQHLNDQLKIYDEKLAREKKSAMEAVNEANQNHDEYMAQYYGNKPGDGSGDSGPLPPAG